MASQKKPELLITFTRLLYVESPAFASRTPRRGEPRPRRPPKATVAPEVKYGGKRKCGLRAGPRGLYRPKGKSGKSPASLSRAGPHARVWFRLCERGEEGGGGHLRWKPRGQR